MARKTKIEGRRGLYDGIHTIYNNTFFTYSAEPDFGSNSDLRMRSRDQVIRLDIINHVDKK